MTCWQWLVERLRPLTDFLHHRDSIDPLLHTCVLGTDQEEYKHLLQRPFNQLYTGRWGSIVEVLKQVLDIEVLYR